MNIKYDSVLSRIKKFCTGTQILYVVVLYIKWIFSLELKINGLTKVPNNIPGIIWNVFFPDSL